MADINHFNALLLLQYLTA